MARYSIQIEDVGNVFAGLDKRSVSRGFSRGLNKLSVSVRKTGRLSIRENYSIKASAVTKAMKLEKSTPSTLRAAVIATGKRISYLHFPGTKQTRLGVVVRVQRGKKKLIPHAFIADIPVKGDKSFSFATSSQVFRRVGKSRLPIKATRGPAVAQMFGAGRTIQAMEKTVNENLDRIVAHEVAFEMDKTIKRTAARNRIKPGDIGKLIKLAFR